MVKIREAVVVEGRYDKNTLSQIVDTAIFETAGFGIFKDRCQMALLRAVAQKRGLIVFTDPDGAGLVIRNHIRSAIDPAYLKHAYIPEILGKERRKATAGKEGLLGVEGASREQILQALRGAGATFESGSAVSGGGITKADFYELGLSGREQSKTLRQKLQQQLKLPGNMSANALLQALNILYTKEELEQLLECI